MNNQRRKALEQIAAQIEDLQSQLDDIRNDEQEYFDNMPESFQYAEKGEKAQAAIDALENAVSACGEAMEYINEAGE